MPYLGNLPAERYSSADYQDLTGGTGTSFTLNHPVGNAQEVLVVVNNVVQEPGVAYTVSGTGLTMTGSIASTDDFYVVFRGKAVLTATFPSDRALTATDGTFTGRLGVGVTDPSQDIDLVGTANSGSGSVRAGGTGSGTQAAFIAQAQYGSASFGTYGSYPAILNSSNSPVVYFDTNNGGRAILDEGITFNGDTAAANALDDYEEGTWTPTLSGATTAGSITYSQQYGYYTKIGNVVHIDMRIVYTAFSGSAGAARIAGLPYNVKNATSYAPVSSNWMTFSNTFDTAGFPIFYGVANADRFHGLVSKNNTAWADWASSDFHLSGGTKYLNLTATYQTG